MAGIKDVAFRAGVSPSTVSIVLNGNAEKRKISKEMQGKVLRAMEELQYIPNNYAKYLRHGEKPRYSIALFWSFDFRRVMMTRFLSGLQEGIDNSQADASIVVYPYAVEGLYKHRGVLMSGAVNAAVIANADNADIEFLEKEDFPVRAVLYNREHDKFNSVNMDNAKIGKIAAAHLYEKGYRKPAVVYGDRNFQGASLREQSFFDETASLGSTVDKGAFFEAENSAKGGAECAGRILEKCSGIGAEMPDSFFCASDAIAIGLTNFLTGKGIRIPDDVGVIAIGNGEPQYSKYNNPSITVINIPMESMALAAYEMIYEQRYLQEFKPQSIFFETELLPRKSTDRN